MAATTNGNDKERVLALDDETLPWHVLHVHYTLT